MARRSKKYTRRESAPTKDNQLQNEKTDIMQRVADFLSSPFTKQFGTEEQPKFDGQDGVMYNGKMVHPDFYKLLMNRSDLKQKFDTNEFGPQKSLLQILTFGNEEPKFNSKTLDIMAVDNLINKIYT
mgnify:CR=1 FL=1